jgi:beta-galactosidase
MRKLLFALSIYAFIFLNVKADERLMLNFNPGWKFIQANPQNAQYPNFDDRNWAAVSTPHTYNDVDTFDDMALPGLRGETNQWSGRTWYRKTFIAPSQWQGKQIYVEFQAVRQVADVYLNGHYLGSCKNGFIPFGFDLTPYLQVGKLNVLAVMCDNQFMFNPMKPKTDETSAAPGKETSDTSDSTAPPPSGTTIENLQNRLAKESSAIPTNVVDLQANQIPWNNPQWHPAMGGIYRDVKLIVVDPLHISLPLYEFLQTEGPYIYSTAISARSATVNVELPVQNGRSTNVQALVTLRILDHAGNPVALGGDTHETEKYVTIPAGTLVKQKFSVTLSTPQLWEPDYPCLYRAVCSVSLGDATVDSVEVPFGIRAVHWDVRTGFTINGNHLKLRGWGQKPVDEWPGLGDAMPDWMHFYTLDLMKGAGGNWVRWGHCAGGPVQIQSCDELGLLVEQPGVDGEADTVRAAWRVRADAFRDAIIYYRNDPSIVIWEGGNQKVTTDHAAELRGYVDKYDPYGGRAYAHRRADQKTGQYMNVTVGTEGSHEVPRLPVVEGEYDREESPRRVWDAYSPPNTDYHKLKGQSYNLNSEQFAVNEIRQWVRKVSMTTHSGGANWIFTDSTSGGRDTTEVDRASGEVDGVRLPKEAYYVCRTLFSDQPRVHIIGHWTYPAGTRKTVYVASNCQDVELFVNGTSLGHGKVSNRYLFEFDDVAFAPGEIKAVGYNGGAAAVQNSIRTAGPAAALRMTPIFGPNGLQADGSDIALIDVEAVDATGQRCPTFQQRVDFGFGGPMVWRGGYNSGKVGTINKSYLDLEAGINRVAVRSTLQPGKITVTARCAGLPPATLTFTSQPIPFVNGYSAAMPLLPKTQLAATHRSWAALSAPVPAMTSTALTGNEAVIGHYIESFAYTGPTEGARVFTNAADGGKIYSDTDLKFADLPKPLVGADWIQVPTADSLYSAVDLIQLVVMGGTDAYVAHDERLPAPEWLTNQFKIVTDVTFTVNGQPMQLFRHANKEEGSITLGSNTEDSTAKEGNAYIVFVNTPYKEAGSGPATTNATGVASNNVSGKPAATNSAVKSEKPVTTPSMATSSNNVLVGVPATTAAPAKTAPVQSAPPSGKPVPRPEDADTQKEE